MIERKIEIWLHYYWTLALLRLWSNGSTISLIRPMTIVVSREVKSALRKLNNTDLEIYADDTAKFSAIIDERQLGRRLQPSLDEILG